MAQRVYTASLKTKQRIYKTAMAMFIQDGYASTSLKDIAKAADVSMGTMYRYFPSKSDFFTEIGPSSVEHLRDFVAELPEDMPVTEKILAVLMEDVRGNQQIFCRQVEKDGRIVYEPNDLRAAYNSAYVISPDHFETEMALRVDLVEVYQNILEQAVECGEVVCFDCRTLAEIITAVFFQEDEKSAFTSDYPFEANFRKKIGALMEGKLL